MGSLEEFDNDMFPCTMFKWNELMMHDSTLQCAILGIMDNKHGTQNECLGPFYDIFLAPSPMAFHCLPRCQSPIQ